MGLGAGAFGARFGLSAALLGAAELSVSVSFAAESLSGVAAESESGAGLSEAAFLSEFAGGVVSVDLTASVGGGLTGPGVAGAGGAATLPPGASLGFDGAGCGIVLTGGGGDCDSGVMLGDEAGVLVVSGAEEFCVMAAAGFFNPLSNAKPSSLKRRYPKPAARPRAMRITRILPIPQ